MSCSGRAYVPDNVIDPSYGVRAPARRLWLWRVLAAFGAIVAQSRQHQIGLELQKARQRRLLLQLDDRLLEDIGITREQAEREGNKAFWE